MHVLRLGDLLRNNLSGLDQFCLELQRWMQFWVFGAKLEEDKMSTLLQDTPTVLGAYEEFKRFAVDPEMREKVRARERFLIDQRLKLAGARREGEAIGEARGEARGKAEEKIATARNLQRLGIPAATIAEATGLPLAEIERL
jgi:predicted transposase/invertase (TIGR01784 family)